ncbi:MAG: putative NIF3 family GTP cyclohydrolase 1 type 2, partial [Bradymonadia bacterium]
MEDAMTQIISLKSLERSLDALLAPSQYSDYAPNGLQVEGRSEVGHVVVGVSANQALIDRAIELRADAVIVHHGFFWKGEPQALRGW